MSRGRGPAISRAERQRWLGELEKGMGITAIARAAGKDIRVVKRQLDMAEHERELRQARGDFLRSRLEAHQEDLLVEAGRLRELVRRGTAYSLEPKDSLQRRVHEALKQHVRRMALWRLLGSYWETAGSYREARDRLRKDLKKKESELVSRLSPEVETYSWTEVLLNIFDRHISTGYPWKGKYEMIKAGSGYYPEWEGLRLTRTPVTKANFSKVTKAHEELRSVAESALPEIHGYHQRLRELGALIARELEVFLLKRLVSGRCDYCPA